MAESGEQVVEVGQEEVEEEDDVNPNYKAPEKKSMQEILETDQDDESLVNYKKQLMGDAATSVIIDKNNPNFVIIKKLEIEFEDEGDETQSNQSMDLTGDLSTMKDTKLEVVEGSKYKIAIVFNVQREIVTGLKLHQTAKRKGIQVEKRNLMMGSYGPKVEESVFRTPTEEAPKGMLARGTYNMKSTFSDDDKHKYVEFEWKIEIVKKRK